MKELPILFSTPMVQAILAGRKTQTRRIMEVQPEWAESTNPVISSGWFFSDQKSGKKFSSYPNSSDFAIALADCVKCPYGEVGDQLWVREAWRVNSKATDLACIVYRASENDSWTNFHKYFPVDLAKNQKAAPSGWKPSIHMPRWACRIFLEITDIRIERLQDISEEDAIAEGIISDHVIVGAHCASGRHTEEWATRYFYDGGDEEGYECAVDAYAALWEFIKGADSWAANPWVWVISFRVVQGGDV